MLEMHGTTMVFFVPLQPACRHRRGRHVSSDVVLRRPLRILGHLFQMTALLDGSRALAPRGDSLPGSGHATIISTPPSLRRADGAHATHAVELLPGLHRRVKTASLRYNAIASIGWPARAGGSGVADPGNKQVRRCRCHLLRLVIPKISAERMPNTFPPL